tara:strand:+ start:1823 stop:2914 length:1092 start_codon:yes stop_codon:yes gene_type:complete
MKITKTDNPPKEDKLFEGANYPVEQELNPEDVIEIFQTPLTGCYNWDYKVQDNRIKKLYELGKELEWNVEKDVDWNHPKPEIDDEGFEFFNNEWKDHKQYSKLSNAERKQFVRDSQDWTLSQLMHGEQGALLVASQLTSCAPTFNAKLYAASQTFDEARHVEAFNKYLQTRMGRIMPIGKNLKALLDKVLTDPRWDFKFIGMQIIIEGLALAIFNTMKESTQDPVLKRILSLVIRDEARHVTFGVNYLTSFVTTLTPEEKIEREDFCLEACTVMRNRFKQYEVWEKYGFDLDYTDEYVKENAFQGRFQHLLFTRVMPNLKKIGLLPDRLLPKYEQLGVSEWIDLESDYETSWEELSKPLESVA